MECVFGRPQTKAFAVLAVLYPRLELEGTGAVGANQFVRREFLRRDEPAVKGRVVPVGRKSRHCRPEAARAAREAGRLLHQIFDDEHVPERCCAKRHILSTRRASRTQPAEAVDVAAPRGRLGGGVAQLAPVVARPCEHPHPKSAGTCRSSCEWVHFGTTAYEELQCAQMPSDRRSRTGQPARAREKATRLCEYLEHGQVTAARSGHTQVLPDALVTHAARRHKPAQDVVVTPSRSCVGHHR
mmetsp:Transcript_4009/g.10201  ORF Transcript_4009/g.10201 Transcript_4009/m.10201 type:complete len:242 (+) Transcript_4009:114-839(+)